MDAGTKQREVEEKGKIEKNNGEMKEGKAWRVRLFARRRMTFALLPSVGATSTGAVSTRTLDFFTSAAR